MKVNKIYVEISVTKEGPILRREIKVQISRDGRLCFIYQEI